MADVNKAKKRRASANGPKYSVQYGRTYSNKRRAITAHIQRLEAALAAASGEYSKSPWDATERKIKNIEAALKDAQIALLGLKLKA
jgi:hypothetical protein